MRTYIARATSDWGFIYVDERIEASSFRTAFGRAAKKAKDECRKRPKQITITLRSV